MKSQKVNIIMPVDLLREIDRRIDKYSPGPLRNRTAVIKAAVKTWIKTQKVVK